VTDDTITYCIPLGLWKDYTGRHVVVRTDSPAALAAALTETDCEQIAYVQLFPPCADLDSLNSWAPGCPIDLVLQDPANELPLIYQFANLLDKHPARVTVPVVHGFGKAVKLAVSLDLPVKLTMEQPDQSLIEELDSVLSLCLFQGTCNQPVGFLYELLFSYVENETSSLWTIQEDHPSRYRYVTDAGDVDYLRAPDGWSDTDASVLERLQGSLGSEELECHHCDFLERCEGYLKCPDAQYSCAGIKSIFRTIAQAGDDLKQDLAEHEAAKQGSQL
jgi:hypothetical protein